VACDGCTAAFDLAFENLVGELLEAVLQPLEFGGRSSPTTRPAGFR
jgi:hypothetical protein